MASNRDIVLARHRDFARRIADNCADKLWFAEIPEHLRWEVHERVRLAVLDGALAEREIEDMESNR